MQTNADLPKENILYKLLSSNQYMEDYLFSFKKDDRYLNIHLQFMPKKERSRNAAKVA